MLEITKYVDIAAIQAFNDIGFQKLQVSPKLSVYRKPASFGFESVSTTQIQTSISKGVFWTTILIKRRIDVIEGPFRKIFEMFSRFNAVHSATFNFSYNYFFGLEGKKYPIGDVGIKEFQDTIRDNYFLITEIANKYNDIKSIDKLLNSEYHISEEGKQILLENVPRMIKRLLIAKLADNPIWKVYYERTLHNYEDALLKETSHSFIKIFEKRIEALELAREILLEIEPLKDTRLF